MFRTISVIGVKSVFSCQLVILSCAILQKGGVSSCSDSDGGITGVWGSSFGTRSEFACRRRMLPGKSAGFSEECDEVFEKIFLEETGGGPFAVRNSWRMSS
jgi:hypothetical protein